MNITEFLEARIADDEAGAWEVHRADCDTIASFPCNCPIPTRIAAECAAKRVITAEHELAERSNGIRTSLGCVLCNYDRDYGWEEVGPCKTLRAIASIYTGQPDYQQEWKL